jgi:hypothetical protein
MILHSNEHRFWPQGWWKVFPGSQNISMSSCLRFHSSMSATLTSRQMLDLEAFSNDSKVWSFALWEIVPRQHMKDEATTNHS